MWAHQYCVIKIQTVPILRDLNGVKAPSKQAKAMQV